MDEIDNIKDLEALFRGLRSLSESAFPKICNSCGRIYRSSEDFVVRSLPMSSGASGLKEALDDDDRAIIELFRNCVCGSTLMDFFSDRRDVSEAGEKRRKAFSKIHARLVGNGLETKEARTELLRFMRGEKSPLLEKLGLMNQRSS